MEGLYRTIGKRQMSQFIEDLVRPHVMDSSLDEGYKAMNAAMPADTSAATKDPITMVTSHELIV